MGKIDIEPWEPEETVGKLWHAFASRLGAPEVHHGAAVGLDEVGGRLAVLSGDWAELTVSSSVRSPRRCPAIASDF